MEPSRRAEKVYTLKLSISTPMNIPKETPKQGPYILESMYKNIQVSSIQKAAKSLETTYSLSAKQI